MINEVVGSSTINILAQGLHAANTRHQVISNNIANVNTPGFKKSEVTFESLLAKQLDPGSGDLDVVRTNDKHLPMGSLNGEIAPQIKEIGTTTMRTDGNNVDVDIEMADLAKNNIYYNAMVRQIGDYMSSLKSVIAGQK
ncbi:flagellar basal body rod protein FlgB [Propionispira raffinosivorans]|jgi:flagellar basal-body rod protein FlgB|uniref:flagellar basal body rod protein FlgB n=1 Tax=Propionispira raffinosivorans TaxID=86959 RepID=UPI000363B502|nr:flagellar basal body rod protein FlgB [Propionispira raffinosivorans]